MLPYNQAVQAVGLGKGGLQESVSGAKTWIDFSSIDKKTIVGVEAELARKGWTILDGSADYAISRRWSVNGYVSIGRGGRVVTSAFTGHTLAFGYVENVLQF